MLSWTVLILEQRSGDGGFLGLGLLRLFPRLLLAVPLAALVLGGDQLFDLVRVVALEGGAQGVGVVLV